MAKHLKRPVRSKGARKITETVLEKTGGDPVFDAALKYKKPNETKPEESQKNT